jgi:hypothetical protein
MSDKKYTLRKLESYLKSKDFNITRVFHDDKRVLFMTVKNENLFEEVLLLFDNKFSILVENIDIKTNAIEVRYCKQDSSLPSEEHILFNDKLEEVKSDEMIDDEQKIKEGLSMHNYKTIDIDSDVLDQTQSQYISQLEKFRECVKNLKYKFGILSYNYIYFIQRNNSVSHYGIKHKHNFLSNDKPNFVVSIDIENLFESIETFVEDVMKLYKNFYQILSNAHRKQISALECQINTLTDVPVLLKEKNKKLNEMSLCIDDTSNILTTIYKEEIRLKKLFQEIDQVVCKNPSEEKQKDQALGKLQRELEQIRNKKERTQTILKNLKTMYNAELISFDYNIFKSVHLFEHFAEKVKKVL